MSDKKESPNLNEVIIYNNGLKMRISEMKKLHIHQAENIQIIQEDFQNQLNELKNPFGEEGLTSKQSHRQLWDRGNTHQGRLYNLEKVLRLIIRANTNYVDSFEKELLEMLDGSKTKKIDYLKTSEKPIPKPLIYANQDKDDLKPPEPCKHAWDIFYNTKVQPPITFWKCQKCLALHYPDEPREDDITDWLNLHIEQAEQKLILDIVKDLNEYEDTIDLRKKWEKKQK